MSPDFIADAVKKVVAGYGAEHVRVAKEGARTLVRVERLELQPGCAPPATPLLLVLDPGQPKPQAYVQPGQLLANGKAPTSTSVQLVGGESWLQFSFNVPWEERRGIGAFIAAARQRFEQDA